MFPIFRLLFAAAIAITTLSAIAQADTARANNGADSAAVAAITAAHHGDWAKAYAQLGQSHDPLALKIVHWLDYTRSSAGGRFSEIAAFIDHNPGWPLQKTLRRRAEEALASESDDVAAGWFKRHKPITGAGKARAAEIEINRGHGEAGTADLRTAWIDGDFTIAGERAVLTRFADRLRAEDHWKRLDRLLWDGQSEAAKRLLPLVAADYRALAEARLALAADAGNAGKLVAKVPEKLRDDPGLAFDQARWWRKKDNYDNAARLLLAHADTPEKCAAWWDERLLVARKLLAAGNSDTAARLVQQPETGSGKINAEPNAEAEFLSGYIALRYKKDAAAAFDHFAHMLAHVTSPYAKARAAYWGGRAAAAAGKDDLAAKWYTVGADNLATFYGQLAAHQLGDDAPPHPVPEHRPDPATRARFDAQELVRVAQLLFAAGDGIHARTVLMRMTEDAKTPLDFAMLAALAESHNRIDLAIAVARRSIDAGMPLMVHGYPVTPLPAGGITERPLLLAIVRQESAFAVNATSRVGARGLMQLMPATAAGVASKLQLPFSLARLSTDGLYNLTLGRSYIEHLLDDFGGSYALSIAAYNAGPGRVRQWLHDFGDPRGTDLSTVDWIEMIPFNETRSYVQRVLENLQIYRGQSPGNPSAFSLAADLAR
ncbi:MAG: lytic transglycosylase domain-containing protein [Thiohalocapsa sp.]